MRFIKIHPNISSAMTSDEIALYILLMEQDFAIKNGSSRGWSRDFLMRSTGMKRHKFKTVADGMEAKRLIRVDTPSRNGMKNSYIINNREIDCLMRILDKTNNKEYLREFIDKLYSSGRFASDVTEDEMVKVGESVKTWSLKNKEDSVDISDVIKEIDAEDKVVNLHIEAEKEDKLDKLLERMEETLENQEKILDLVSVFKRVCRFPTPSVQISDTHSIDKRIYNKIDKNNMGVEGDEGKDILFPEKEPKRKYEDSPLTLQVLENSNNDNIPPSTKKDKTMELLNLPENKYAVDSLKGYFEERYPEGSAETLNEAISFFQTLTDEIWWDNDDLLNISFLDVFRDFVTKDDKVFMFYDKSSENSLKASTDELNAFTEMEIKNKLDENTLNLPEKEKVKYIQEAFRDAFINEPSFELESANEFVASFMRDLNTPSLQQIKFNNPRLAVMILGEYIQPTNYDQFFWEVVKNLDNTSKLKKIDNNNLGIITETDDYDELEVFITPEDNIYPEIFERFRITRRMDTDDIATMVSEMLSFARIPSETTIRMDDLGRFIYGAANKLSKTPREIYDGSRNIFSRIKNEASYMLTY